MIVHRRSVARLVPLAVTPQGVIFHMLLQAHYKRASQPLDDSLSYPRKGASTGVRGVSTICTDVACSPFSPSSAV